MKGIISFTTVLNGRSKRPRRDGTLPVQIRAYLNGRRRLYPSGLYVLPTQWDKTTYCVINHPLAAEYNAELTRQKLDYECHILDLKRRGRTPTLQQLDNFREYGNLTSLLDFMEHELLQANSLSEGTIKNHKQAFQKVRDYRPDTQFADLNYLWVSAFDNSMREAGLSTNTVNTHHKQVIRYINLAIKKEVYDGINPYSHFIKKGEKTFKVILSPHEIAQIENLDLSLEPYLERIRDMFLFCCYTGLRGTDAAALRYCDVFRSKEGYKINIAADKTDKQMLLPLHTLYNGKPELLVKRYEDKKKVRPNSSMRVFFDSLHEITNQYINRELHKIEHRIGLKKSLTSHVGRYTFATDMASRVSSFILNRILQHKSMKTTAVYVDLAQKDINKALEEIKW